jgi:hypothetical protein
MASNKFKKGSNYLDLSDIYVVFLLEEDEFGTNKTMERIKEHVESTKEQLESFVHYIFINGSIDDGSKISHLMEKFNDSTKYNDEFKNITEVTNRIKYRKGGEDDMGKTMFQEYKEQLIEESIAIGRESGKQEVCIELFRDGSLTAEKAAEKLGISVEEFLEKYGQQ